MYEYCGVEIYELIEEYTTLRKILYTTQQDNNELIIKLKVAEVEIERLKREAGKGGGGG